MFFKKKKEKIAYDENAKFKVLGMGCKKCTSIYNILLELKKENYINGEITKLEDPALIVKYGVISTPAIVMKEKVISQGKTFTKNGLKELIDKQK